MIEITVTPAQGGAAKATVSFTDEDGASVVPSSVKWTLSDKNGAVINNRSFVTLTPGASVSWLISGADLCIGSYGTDRILTIDALYTSTLGSNIPLRAQASFSIEKFAIEV